MENWHQLSKEETLKKLNVSTDGLSESESARLLAEKGRNVLKEGKKKTPLQVFLRQFADLLVIILIAAAVISIFSGNLESAIVIFAVITMNAVIGTVQYVKAQKTLDSLKALSSPSSKVIRGGGKTVIRSENVVEGDLIVLEAGDLVAADGRILNSYSLQVNESSLTGEAASVDKREEALPENTPLADRTNMVYSGSLVTYGRAIVAVTGTGMNTEIGKIAKLMNSAKEKKTPLQESLDRFSSMLAAIIIIISAAVFGLSVLRNMEVIDALMFAVALAVAAIPEVLGSIVTIVQAMGTQKMARQNAVIKDLKAVESLGCVSVICSDKTGTLTQNKMTVQKIYIEGESILCDRLDLNNEAHRMLLYDMALNNDSSIVNGKGIGDPTEYALLDTLRELDLNEEDIRAGYERLEEVPFDSERKLMSTKYRLHGVEYVLTKGALDSLLERCDRIAAKGGVRELTEGDREDILNRNNSYSENGLRVLAFAYKKSDGELSVKSEYGYIFLGLVSMMDPPREESKQAVADAIRAGIKPVMITGDHKVTARAIAEQIGIFREGDIAVTGAELDAMSDEELDEKISKISVYARVSPENKLRIVSAWQKKGNVAAMTGDGVNDAPALKKADIGVAMGITGTEVSKDAASMVLQDDNFATIIKAVSNGRSVYNNIKNAILYLLSGNMAAVITVLYTTLSALPIPFEAVHLLFINLLTDSLPAIAIGMEKPDRDLLSKKPRDPKKGILTKDFTFLMFAQGALIAAAVIFAYRLGLQTSAAAASTMAFATLTLARLFHGFNCRSSHSMLRAGVTSNAYIWIAFTAGAALLAFVLFVPFMQPLFSIISLSSVQFGYVALLAFIPTFIIQAVKTLHDLAVREK